VECSEPFSLVSLAVGQMKIYVCLANQHQEGVFDDPARVGPWLAHVVRIAHGLGVIFRLQDTTEHVRQLPPNE